MRDLLLNRFRGALRGAVLGEAVGMTTADFTWADVRSGSWLQAIDSLQASHWLMAAAQPLLITSPNRSEEIALALPLTALPAALFFHDHPAQLQQQIQHLTSRQPNAIEQAGVFAFSEAIALALREELLPRQILPHLSTAIAPLSLPLADQLTQVQTWLAAEASLAAVERSIASLPPSLATWALTFYCWLSTPADFNLALLRSQRGGPMVAALVGALAGADLGVSSIAIDWWQPFTSSEAESGWGARLVAPIDRLAEQLLAAWAGADPFDQPDALAAWAIASAGLIRPR